MKISFSLNTKIVVFTSVMILLTTSLIASVVLYSSRNYFVQRSIDFLNHETSLISQNIQNSFNQLTENLIILSHTPPIQKIIEAKQKNDKDAQQQWKDSLATIFKALMKVNKTYTQVRYIEAANHGKELVRINRVGEKIFRTPESELQKKDMEPYFKKGIKTPEGNIMFSEVTYNREHGKVEYPLVPTLRVLMPIYDKNHKLFGILVININYETYLKKILSNTVSTKNLFLYNEYHDYFEYNPESKKLIFVKHDQPKNKILKKTENILDFSQKILLLKNDENKIAILKPIYSDKLKKNSPLTLLISIEKATLFKPDNQVIYNIFEILLIIVFISIIITFFFSKWLMRHLKEMTHAINMSNPNDHGQMPVQLNDEIGVLARAFMAKTELLRKMALYDSLTGLANRNHFLDHLHGAIFRSNRSTKLMAIFFIDLNLFKEINDHYGHNYGDELLISFANKMQSISRQTDFIGRLGGDEFGIIIEDLDSFEDIKIVENRFTPLLANTYIIKDIPIKLTVSIGVAIYPLHGQTVDELIKAADIAMYKAKEHRTGRWVIYSKEFGSEVWSQEPGSQED